MNPFENKKPSVFSVSSPFQALCAISAIMQLEIDDYIFLVRLRRGDARNSQITRTLKLYGIRYKGIRLNRITSLYFKYKTLIRRSNRYKRLFIGDYRDTMNIYLGCGMVSDKSDIIYLDDGNPTISQLRGRETEPFDKKVIDFMSLLSSRRGFIFNKNVFTIYSDIQNSNYDIYGLSLDIIAPKTSKDLHQSKGVYIVGTNVERYCIPMEINIDFFISYLDMLMQRFHRDYPDDEIIYMAHGKETLQYAQSLCKKNNCVFCLPSTMVELELLSYESRPKVIVGFGSNALFTLKKIFPSTRVVNVLFRCSVDNPFYIDNLDFSKYYEQNGIELIGVDLRIC